MKKSSIKRLISKDRIQPYLHCHKNNFDLAIEHYKANIRVSESFYPLISVLEVGLRNNINSALTKKYKTESWFENSMFIKEASSFQIDRISDARKSILIAKKEVTPGRIVSGLSLGFWTSLLDSRFERIFWKELRLAFPNCPKHLRQRKNMSAKFNGIRKFRNRLFHHEAISWNFKVLENYKEEIFDGISWLDHELLNWITDINRTETVLEKESQIIKNAY